MFARLIAVAGCSVLAGCETEAPLDATVRDGGNRDAGVVDAGTGDADTRRDAGTADGSTPRDGGVDGGGLPASCRRLCAVPSVYGAPGSRPIDTGGANDHNVTISDPLRIGNANYFAFTTRTCCSTPATTVSGVLRAPGLLAVTYPSEASVSLSYLSTPFESDGRVALLRPNADWSEAAALEPGTLTSEETLDLSGLSLGDGSFASPSLVALAGGGYLLLQGREMRLTRLDDAFAPIGGTRDLSFEARWGVLITTCAAIVALFATENGDFYSLALDAEGTPVGSATPSLVEAAAVAPASVDVHAVWDGMAITVTGAGQIIELDPFGALLGVTPFAQGVAAAVGTDSGFVAIEISATPGVILIERSTGTVLTTFGAIGTGTPLDGAVGVADGRVDLAATGLSTRSSLRVSRIDCD